MMIDNSNQRVRNSTVKRCAICDGKFGLVRYHVYQTALCSNRCVDRFRIRRESDGKWLLRWPVCLTHAQHQ
jgi:hypothetical protein